MSWTRDEEGRSEPLVRIRIAHSATIKGGWRHETSVEVTHFEEPSVIAETTRFWLEQADALGRAESARRNALDAKEAAS